MPIKYAVISQAMKGIDSSKIRLQREKAEAAVNPLTLSMRRISTTA